METSAQRVIEAIAVGAYPHGIRISPDGKQAWVANLSPLTRRDLQGQASR